jgi:uncharacterized protein
MTTHSSHAPFMLDTHELGRRPGTSLRVRRTLPAPADLVIGLAAVPDDAELDCDLLLEAVMEGVYVSLRTTVPVVGECARCLDPVSFDVDVEAHELVAYPADDLDDDALVMVGELVDLEPVLRDAIGLALPATLLCRDDCPGLCPECGTPLADDPTHAHNDPVDPRWAALSSLAADGSPTSDDPPEEQ